LRQDGGAQRVDVRLDRRGCRRNIELKLLNGGLIAGGVGNCEGKIVRRRATGGLVVADGAVVDVRLGKVRRSQSILQQRPIDRRGEDRVGFLCMCADGVVELLTGSLRSSQSFRH
jgi:hypothetical protein